MPSLLKSLELNGYKTFATSAEFAFAGAITAIVGPNGSGKSNIADALRWVLGEQSYSLLRGRKTEDMIFSGSENRPRAGMASASVLFDNSDGWLPIDFSEVSISRRAYRDGQNEYLINGQRVRLRDVMELLAKSGLAERTYTIIGQGLVDAALSLRADERRRLFEEAAGIGLYRSRREEALRRLENTRRNLDRVKDILAELRPRLRSLERQARRAQEYDQVRDDLKQILLEWYGYHWHHSQRELIEVQEVARTHDRTLAEAREKQELIDSTVGEQLQAIQDLRGRLGDWHSQMAGLHSRREQITRQLAVMEERQRSMQNQRDDLQSALTRLDEEIQFETSRAEDTEAVLRRRLEELEDARNQLGQASAILTGQEDKRIEIETQIGELQELLRERSARHTTLVAQRAEISQRAERQAKQLAELDQGLEQAVSALEQIKGELQQRRQNLKEAARRRQSKQDQVDRLSEELEGAESQLRSDVEELAAVQADVTKAQTRLDVLQQADQALLGYGGGAKLLFQLAREDGLRGFRGAFKDHLEVPAAYETAVAAALGEFLDAVVIDDLEGAGISIKRLQEGKVKGVILPLDALDSGRGSLPVVPDGEQGLIGVAADLVDSQPQLEPAVRLLLGRILVVRDVETARRLVGAQPPNVRIVTLQGEVFYAEGPVIAGLPEGSGGLGRARRILELGEELARHQQRFGELEASVRKSTESVRRLEESVEVAQEALGQERLREAEAQTALDEQTREVQNHEQRLRWQQERKAGLATEIEQDQKTLVENQSEQGALAQHIGEMQEQLRDVQRLLKEVPLDEHRDQLKHWELQVAVAEQVVTESRQRFEERTSFVGRVSDQRAASETRLQSLEEGLQSLVEQQQRLREESAEVDRQLEALAVHTEPAELELKQSEEVLESTRKGEMSARQALAQAERYYTQSQIALARHQEGLSTLRQRIEDDFGLVAFEYEDQISGPTPLPLEGMVEQLPVITDLSPDTEDALRRKRAQLRRIGAINPEAQAEFKEVQERHTFLTTQMGDLETAEEHVLEVIAELDELMQREFRKTFDAVAVHFREIFTRLFGGGSARLILTDPTDLTATGIDIDARLPGRRTQGLSLLSGGERSLTATALVFALLRVSPTPFCVLDEVDAMLDEANVGRFRELLRELSAETQFILITHNRGTVQVADVIYGITMGRDSASQVLSLKLDQVAEVVPG